MAARMADCAPLTASVEFDFPGEQHVSEPINAIPWGLGWAARLGGPNLTRELPPGEAYSVILFFGLMALSVPTCVIGAASLVLQAGSLSGGLGLLSIAVLSLVCMVVVATSPRWFRPAVWLLLLAVVVAGVFNTYSAGGIVASGFQPIWFLIAPLGGSLLLGPRGGFVLTVMAMLALLAIPVLPEVFGPVSEPTPMPVSGILGSFCSFTVCLFLALNWFIGQRRIVEQQLEQERARAEELLHNVLPSEIAERLKTGEAEALFHEEVSVLFADLVGFTLMSQDMSASRLVKMLDGLFGEFDALVEQYGLCKIKTIGDCYMVAAGVPTAVDDHAERLSRFALSIRDLVANRGDLSLRIGMDSGPVVAGIIGKKRFLFDLWGDTVNTASRMESHGDKGRIQVTERMQRRLNSSFAFEDRGEIEIKGKGPMRTFFLQESL
jgi:guanylate cyclase